MDSINHHHDENIAAIVEGMKSQNVDLSAVRQKILRILADEYLVPEEKRIVDTDLLEVLLDQIEKEIGVYRGKAPVKSFAEIWATIDRKEKRYRMLPNKKQMLMRTVIATPLILALMFFANGLLSYRETVIEQTDDNEQAIVQQITHSPGFVSTSSASNKSLEFSLSETEIDEIKEIFGYMPSTPSWLPENWSLSSYEASSSMLWKTLYSVYKWGDNDSWIRFTNREHGDESTAQGYIEETGEGKTVSLDNGLVLYLTSNTDNLAGVWIDGKTQYTIFGPISPEELMQMANSIYD